MNFKKGDLVACYITNTDEWETLMCWGIIIDMNNSVHDILVLDNHGTQRWWPSHSWKLLSSKKKIKYLDLDVKLA